MKDTKILIAGASGFIGSKLSQYFETLGYTVYRLNTSTPKTNNEFQFYSDFNLDLLENFDAFINLAGSNIAESRWSNRIKSKIVKSRIDSTTYICSIINQLKNPPKVYINASAIGFYGNRPNQILVEDSSKGNGFLADTVELWENSVKINNPKVRVCKTRFGIVISKDAGTVGKLLPIFKLGLGAYFGNGKQYMSWIHIDDLCRAMEFVINNSELNSVINFTAPESITNYNFSKTVAKFLHRSLFLFIPAFAVNIIFGQMGRELFLFDQNVKPEKLINAGFKFKFEKFTIL